MPSLAIVETIETICSGVTPISCPIDMAPIEERRPTLDRLDQPARFARQFDARLLTEAEVANVLVEAIGTEAQAHLHRAHIARLRVGLLQRHCADVVRVANLDAADDDESRDRS